MVVGKAKSVGIFCFRILGRRSGSESRDLRMMITDRQKQSEESSSTSATTVRRPSEELQPDNGEVKSQEMEKDVVKEDNSHSREQSENMSPKLHHRDRESSWRGSRRQENEWRRDRAPRGRSAQRNGGNVVSRRGRERLRPGPRRESGSNVPVAPLLGYPPALPSIFTPVDGLLPLPINVPGLSHVPGLSQVQAALQEKIKSTRTEMQMTVVQMLTNPPPVPGEHVPEYDQHRQQPPKRHGLPKWLQRTRKVTLAENNDQQVINEANVSQTQQESTVVKTGGEVSQYETTDNACRQEAVAWGFQNDFNSSTISDVEKLRLARESRSSTDYNSEMQVVTSKRKSPFHDEESQHGGKIVIATSPEGLPQPRKKIHPKGYCFQQLDTGCCTVKSCKYMHLPYAKLVEVRVFGQQSLTGSQPN